MLTKKAPVPRRIASTRDEIEQLRVKLDAAKFVLAEREAELLRLKGPCSDSTCRLHYAHSGPCDTRLPSVHFEA